MTKKMIAAMTAIAALAGPIAGVASDVTRAERTATDQNREEPRSREQQHGMAGHHGMGGMMGMHGMMGGCCSHMGRADVSVERTATGAVVHFDARDGNVERVQRMAEMMGHCMGAGRSEGTSSGN